MKIAILDPAAGISGDMTLGALVDAGVDPEWLRGLPSRLGFADVRVKVHSVERATLAATKVDFDIHGRTDAHDHHHGLHEHGHHVGDIIRRIESAPISQWVRDRSVAAFRLLGEAEGRVHGVEPEQVHLHEVGAIDAILDIVGAVEGFEQLGVDRIHHFPVAVGHGWVEAAHGQLPIPAPATAFLLAGVEVRSDGPVEGEATTPTGAALVRVLSAGPPPAHWRLTGAGWGAGTRNPERYANALRLILAETASEAGTLEVIATDLDDLSPEYIDPLRAAILESGAVDCTIWTTHGKKGRLGFRVEALAPPGAAEGVREAIFRHSTTAGVRQWSTTRATLNRREMTVQMAPSVLIRVKVLDGPGGPSLKPEYDDVADAAARLKQPAHRIAEVARQLAVERLQRESGYQFFEERKSE